MAKLNHEELRALFASEIADGFLHDDEQMLATYHLRQRMGDSPEFARLRAYQADFTPVDVVRQILGWIAASYPAFAPRTMLDPCAGSGVWSMVARETWPVHTIAYEIREEEREHLTRNADDVRIESLELSKLQGQHFDLIAGNPRFQLIKTLMPGLLDHGDYGGIVCLYAQEVFGQRAEWGYRLFETHRPNICLRITGTVAHRTDRKVDQNCYCAWIWDGSPKPADGSFRTINLPWLDGGDRKFRVRPGRAA